MAEGLTHLVLDQKLLGLIPGSTPFCSSHRSGSNSQIQAHKVDFLCLPSCLSDETLTHFLLSVPHMERLFFFNNTYLTNYMDAM